MKTIAGLPVVNATRALRLQVTEKDIAQGERLNPNSCAIAVAAVKRLKGVKRAKVHSTHIYLLMDGAKQWLRFDTTAAARREAFSFDRGGTFYPGEFDLQPPSVATVIKRARKSSGPKAKRSKGSAPKQRYFVPGVREHAYRDDEIPRKQKPDLKVVKRAA